MGGLLIPATHILSPFGRFSLRPYEEADDNYVAGILLDDRTWEHGFGASIPRIPKDYDDAVDVARIRREGVPLLLSVVENHSGMVIGTTGITHYMADFETARMGRTLINPDNWGAGVNHEVKIAFFDYLFSSDNTVGRVECHVARDNTNSTRSLESFGFTSEGVRRRDLRTPDGKWRDTTILSLLVEEWAEVRERVLMKMYAKGFGQPIVTV